VPDPVQRDAVLDRGANQHDTRAPEKVRAEFSLAALTYNIRRVLNLVAYDELMAAVTAWPG
jgi:hypothetical protein